MKVELITRLIEIAFVVAVSFWLLASAAQFALMILVVRKFLEG
jgi:hypothetical protein